MMIEVEHLEKIYGSTHAIQDVTFAVAAGEILGFLGPNGAGKTTTMRILSGYMPATQGTARIAGYDVHEQSLAVRQRIGYLPENPPLYPEMTVAGFLDFVARIKGVSPGNRAERVGIALERSGLTEKPTTLIRKLSKGYRQRVGIAQAIVHDPPVIILDEPTVGLDPRQIREVRQLIKNLAGDHTVILSTHILPEVSMTCSRVAIINQGRIVATNTPQELMQQWLGGSGYEVAVEGDVTQIQQQIQQIPGILSIEVFDHGDGGPYPCLRILTEPEVTVTGAQLATAIVQNGWGLHELRLTQANLEDVFLQLTTEESLTEGKPEPGETRVETGDAA